MNFRSAENQTEAGKFFRQNFFSIFNTVILLLGFAYGYGLLRATVTQQNQEIQQLQTADSPMATIQSQTLQNTADIARIRAQSNVIRNQLSGISDQLSRLSQYVIDHQGSLRLHSQK